MVYILLNLAGLYYFIRLIRNPSDNLGTFLHTNLRIARSHKRLDFDDSLRYTIAINV